MTANIRDNYLLYRIRVKRDPDAYGELYDRYMERIYRFVYFKVARGEDAEDITSEVFLKTWEYLRQNKEVHNFAALLYRIARNLVIDFYRQRKVGDIVSIQSEVEEIDVSDGGAMITILDMKIEMRMVVKHVQKLKEEYREALLLRYVEGLELSAVSEILGKSPVGTRVLLHRALKTLKKVLEEQNHQETIHPLSPLPPL